MRQSLRDADAAAPVLGVILIVAVVVIMGSTITVFVLDIGEQLSNPQPNAAFSVESNYFGDGVDRNDSVRITHAGGDKLERERLEVVIGDDVVYNETADSETTNGNYVVPGLVVEVDDSDDFNDLNKPCTLNGEQVSPPRHCDDGPPGDSDGTDPGVVLEWEDNVTAGQTIVIQERNDPDDSYDVMQPGETITIIYRGDGFSAVISEATVAPRIANSN